jgi:hypothetical protein
VNRLQSLYTVSMFRRHLLGETEYDAFLTVAYATQEPSAVFFPDAFFSVPALTAAGLVLLGGLLAGTAARWTRRRGGVG